MSGESHGAVSSWQNNGQSTLRENWAWFLALGIAMILVGAMAIVLPAMATFGATIVLAWLLVLGGVVQACHAFFVRNWSGFFMQGLTAFLYLMVGFLMLANPMGAIFTLTLLLAAFFLFEGMVKLLLALQVRPAANWGWILTSGILALVMAAIIWTNWPGDALWVLGLLVGINVLFSGWATLMFALGAKGISNFGCCGGNRNVTPSA